MKISGEEVRPLFEVDVKDEAPTIWGIPDGVMITPSDILIEVKAYKHDENGKIIPDEEGNPIIETLNEYITSIKVGYRSYRK